MNNSVNVRSIRRRSCGLRPSAVAAERGRVRSWIINKLCNVSLITPASPMPKEKAGRVSQRLCSTRGRSHSSRLRETTADLIARLEMVNRHVGGQQPSASLDTAERSIDACVAYAVSAVISDQSSCTRPILCTRSRQGRVARIQCLESGVGGRHQLPLLRQTLRPPRRLGGSHGTISGCSF